MLKVDDTVQELFLSDSVPKNLTIEFESDMDESLIPTVNFYTGDIFDNAESTLTFDSWDSYNMCLLYCNLNPKSTNLPKYQDYSFYSYKKYIWVTLDFMIEPTDTNYYAPNPGNLYVSYKKLDSEVYGSVSINEDFSNYVNNWKTVTFVIPASNVKYLDCLEINHNDSTPAKNIKVRIKNIQIRLSDNSSSAPQYVKSISRDGIDIYNYINNIYDNITNANIIQESFSLTESLCSQENLKFGLCESAHCEFEVVERYEKFIGKTIMPYISPLTEQNFDYSNIDFNVGNESEGWTWNSGNLKYIFPWNLNINSDYLAYTDYVMLCMRVNILSNDFTKADAPPFFGVGLTLKDQQGNSYSYMLNDVTAPKCGSNRNSIYKTADAMFDSSEPTKDCLPVYVTLPTDLGKLYSGYAGKYVTNVTRIYLVFLDENQQNYTVDITKQITIRSANIALYFVNDINEPSIVYSEFNRTSLQIKDKIKGIPLGVFKISEVKKNHTHDIIKKSITAYDRMSILDQDVGDWLTRYMVITDTGNKRSSASPSFTKFGVEYVRQMFSTYVSLMIRLGILSQDDFPVKYVYKDENFNDVNAAGRYSFDFFYPCEIASGTLHETVGCTHALGDGWDEGSPSDEYFRVTVTPRDGKSDEELFNQYMGNLDDWPKSYIGFPNSACILAICEFIDGSIEKYLLNSGDIVYIKKGYKNLTFYIGAATGSFDSQSKFEPYNADSYIISHYKIESVYVPEDLKELVNAHLRLVYYNYGTQSLGSFSSSVSGKDVVRSLLEINGCFFHMDRYGKPEIIYASKAGLYPSETLYPALDLYPRGMNGPLLSMGRYISMECDDYVVQKYGKIQIKTQSQVKSGESICSYEYIGDENAKNTYIIEDNIFYCAEGTVYEYGSQPEVDEMLKNLFLKIANLNYTPHTTKLRGLPFMECGDRVNLITLTGGIESFIFRRTLKGIHALMDTYEAEGDEYNEALNTFDYKVYTPT